MPLRRIFMIENQNTKLKILRLVGKTAVFVDWANVHGWEKSLKREIGVEKLLHYLKQYSEITETRLYFGEDEHPKSKEFLKMAQEIGYAVVTKPVKYISVAEIEGQKILRRKCDFDMEVCIDVHRLLNNDGVESFVFLTGDGDYEPLYKMLIGLHKQVIVIYTAGHLGREIWAIKNGLFKAQLKNLMEI